ncbi:MAG: hypothetical protein R2692_06895 [Microbacterium sp.]
MMNQARLARWAPYTGDDIPVSSVGTILPNTAVQAHRHRDREEITEIVEGGQTRRASCG